MSNKYIPYIRLAALLIGAMQACTGDEDASAAPRIALQAGSATDTALSFTLLPENATGAAYTVVEQGETVSQNAAQVFAAGAEADPKVAKEYTLTDLEPSTGYVVLAAARNEAGYSDVRTVFMTTARAGEITVALTAGEVTAATVSFTLKPSPDVERCAYICIPRGEPVPQAAELMERGIEADLVEKDYTVTGLDPLTTYIIAAAAKRDDVVSETAIMEMTTSANGESDYDELAECNHAIGYYYGNLITGESGTGLYFITVDNIPWNENGEAGGAGVQFIFGFHARAAEDPAEAVLPAGAYRFDASNTYAPETFDNRHSSWAVSDDQGHKSGEGRFTDGSVTVTRSDGTYEMAAYLAADNGKRWKAVWNGPLSLKNMIPPEHPVAREAQVVYSGPVYGSPQKDHWIIRLSDDLDSPSFILNVDLETEPVSDREHPTLPNGVFGRGQWTIGRYVNSFLLGTYFQTAFDTLLCIDGSITVTGGGDLYGFDCSFKTDWGTPVEITYQGGITLINDYHAPFVEDLDFTADRLYGSGVYYDFWSQIGVYGYEITLADAELGPTDTGYFIQPVNGGPANYLDLCFYSETGAGEEVLLPQGTYAVNDSWSPNTCTAESFIHWDESSWGYILNITGGTAAVEWVEDGTYRIALDAVYGDGRKVRCGYTGRIEFVRNADLSFVPAKPHLRTESGGSAAAATDIGSGRLSRDAAVTGAMKVAGI